MKKLMSAVWAAVAMAAPWSQAQVPAQPKYGCDSAESKQLDFWIGDWDLSYSGGGRSRNRVMKTLDGCVILEEFSGAPGTPLDGRSHSTYDRATKKWKQAWVDKTASYLDFTGGLVDGKMVLAREAEQNGKKFLQRMVFDQVQADSLQWLWQRSDDGGATWKTTWDIAYGRRK